MRVIAKSTLREFWTAHADAEQPLRAWLTDADKAAWSSPNDLTENYSNISILAGNRVCFNIKGNHYRLIIEVIYQAQVLYIKFIGTHSEYSKIDAETVALY